MIASQLVYASMLLQRYEFFFELPIFKYRFLRTYEIIYQKCNIDMAFLTVLLCFFPLWLTSRLGCHVCCVPSCYH